MPRSFVDLLDCWKGCFGQHCSIDIWLAIPLCALRVVFVFVFAKKEMLLALKHVRVLFWIW